MATEAELAWAAGLFEGEGCISSIRAGRTWYLKVAMTDREVLDRFHAIVGRGRIYIHSAHKSKRGIERGWSKAWVWQVGSRGDVLHVLGLLMPNLGSRRRARAEEALRGYVARAA